LKFLAACRFLTIIPIPRLRENNEGEISGSLLYFPLVGLIIGLVLAGLAWVLGLFLPQTIVSVLIIIAALVITGAIHLDGLADTLDGLGGHSVTRRLEIMKDSRHGTYGVAGIVCLLLFKVIALSNLPANLFLLVLIIMPVVGRLAMVYAVSAYPYARPSGLGKAFQSKASPWFIIAVFIIILVPSWFFYYWQGAVVLLLTAGTTWGISAWLKSKFGGLTGDNYGAINEITEASLLLFIIAFQ